MRPINLLRARMSYDMDFNPGINSKVGVIERLKSLNQSDSSRINIEGSPDDAVKITLNRLRESGMMPKFEGRGERLKDLYGHRRGGGVSATHQIIAQRVAPGATVEGFYGDGKVVIPGIGMGNYVTHGDGSGGIEIGGAKIVVNPDKSILAVVGNKSYSGKIEFNDGKLKISDIVEKERLQDSPAEELPESIRGAIDNDTVWIDGVPFGSGKTAANGMISMNVGGWRVIRGTDGSAIAASESGELYTVDIKFDQEDQRFFTVSNLKPYDLGE